ncbi:L-sorbose 1-dehydrogenase-like [Rhodnius prolixus]|uniref:L-sorbose 1-dehydrogenase-like n=1 Tax=Rhodnius prolixus TaxID=13249 RepID=UPI003D187F68
MRYIRGNRADFDDWAAHGNDGWSYAEVLPYFLKAENNSIPNLMDSPYHSTDGPLCISHSNYDNDNPLLREFLNAGNEFGLETLDYNGEQQIAVDYLQSTIHDGTTRCSTAKAYLEPIRYRKNLYIFKNTLVTRIIFDETNRTAVGVECYRNREYFTITATKEVIVTAGAINTPKLLMLSGVGPRRHIEELGIPVIADLPVGETLYDHLYLALNFTISSRLLETFNETSYDIIVDYAKNRDGKLTTANGVEIVAFINQKRLTNFPPDVEILMGPYISIEQNFTIPFLTIAVVKLKPKSIGTVKLQSRNFLVPPLIDPNYFSNSVDIEITKWAIGEIRELTNTASLSKYNLMLITKDVESLCGPIDLDNDTDLECFIRYGTRSLGHPVSTCRMGKITDETSVVDPSLLKVHGFANLRIAGSPIFFDMVRGHTLAASVMTAEKLSDIILSGYNFKP